VTSGAGDEDHSFLNFLNTRSKTGWKSFEVRRFVLERLRSGYFHSCMARQSFFAKPAPVTQTKYGAYTPDRALTSTLKVVILLIGFLGGAAVGSAYSFIAAGDMNRQVRLAVSPKAENEARRAAKRRAAQRMALEAQWAQERQAEQQKLIAERLAQVNPLGALLRRPDQAETTPTATGQASQRVPQTMRERAEPRRTPAANEGTTLRDILDAGRRAIQETPK
jgi:hypothetical protein